jgi:hypothetical protein
LSPILGIIASQDYVRIPPSSYESIATATPSGTSTVTFSSIPSGYVSLQVRFNLINATSGGSTVIRFNGVSGTSYAAHSVYGNGSTAVATSITSYSGVPVSTGWVGGITTYPSVGIIDILDYTSTTKNKTVRCVNGADNNSTGGSIQMSSGVFLDTSAITSLSLVGDYNFNTGSTFALYGIKGA